MKNKYTVYLWLEGSKQIAGAVKLWGKNMFMSNSYDTHNDEWIHILLNWLGREGIQFIQALNNTEKSKCKTSAGMFEVFGEKSKS